MLPAILTHTIVSPYSTGNCSRVGHPTRLKLTQTTANLHVQRKANPCIPNTNYILHIWAPVGHHRLVLGIISSRWVLLAHVGGSRWVRQGFRKRERFVSSNTPKARGFAFQWNIGFTSFNLKVIRLSFRWYLIVKNEILLQYVRYFLYE